MPTPRNIQPPLPAVPGNSLPGTQFGGAGGGLLGNLLFGRQGIIGLFPQTIQDKGIIGSAIASLGRGTETGIPASGAAMAAPRPQTMLERLAASDPGNAGWQRDLSVSYKRIGDVQFARGDLQAALKSYSGSLAITERLAKSDPGNAEWQRDLAASYQNIGNVQEARGDLSAAMKSYSASLAIAERLAASDPGNAGWQRDLAISFGKLALVHKQSGGQAKARDYLRQGQAIMTRLTKLSPDNAVWKQDLDEFNQKIAELAKR
jgi:tetratricopeptide (TPR) repeat protein